MSLAGSTIRDCRRRAGLTQEQLAERIGCSKAHLSLMEAGRRTVSTEWAHKIDQALGYLPDPRAGAGVGIRPGVGPGAGVGPITQAAQWDATPPALRQQVHDSRAIVEQLQRALRSTDPMRALRRIVEQREHDPDHDADHDLDPDIDHDPDQAMPRASSIREIALTHQIPVINRIAAGTAAEFTDLDYPASIADDYIACPDVHDPNAFAARVEGDSMAPEYRAGEIVVFSPNTPVTSGCDCFIRLAPDHEITFKRVFFDDDDDDQDDGTRDSGDAAEPDRAGADDGHDDHDDSENDARSVQEVRLQPLNSAYPPRLVPRARIAGMYPAVYVLRRIAR